MENKKFVLSICLFVCGVVGSGLFAIGQSLMVLARTITEKTFNNQNICGVLCFVFLIVTIVGAALLISEVIKKKKDK
mgnify:CR=1 FL=1